MFRLVVRLDVFQVSAGSLEAIGSSLHVARSGEEGVLLAGLSMGENRAKEARMRERRVGLTPRRDFTCR